MKRREFIAGLAGAAVWPLPAKAQQPQGGRRVALLSGLDESDPDAKQRFTAFRQGLAKLGWSDGDKVRILTRWAAGSVERTRTYASELIGLGPEVIVVNTPIGLKALREGTRSIPIVFVQVLDAGESGADSTTHPGGNITGFYAFFEYGMAGKWLQLLHDAAPRVRRVAVMQNPEHPGWSGYLSSIQSAANAFGIEAIQAPVRGAEEIERVIGNLSKEQERGDGLIVLPDSFTTTHRQLIIAAVTRQRLPNIAGVKSFATAGGLMAYSADLADLLRQSAAYVDRILRGELPGELPVQQSTKFELVVNRKAASVLRLEFPAALLALADEVIE